MFRDQRSTARKHRKDARNVKEGQRKQRFTVRFERELTQLQHWYVHQEESFRHDQDEQATRLWSQDHTDTRQ